MDPMLRDRSESEGAARWCADRCAGDRRSISVESREAAGAQAVLSADSSSPSPGRDGVASPPPNSTSPARGAARSRLILVGSRSMRTTPSPTPPSSPLTEAHALEEEQQLPGTHLLKLPSTLDESFTLDSKSQDESACAKLTPESTNKWEPPEPTRQAALVADPFAASAQAQLPELQSPPSPKSPQSQTSPSENESPGSSPQLEGTQVLGESRIPGTVQCTHCLCFVIPRRFCPTCGEKLRMKDLRTAAAAAAAAASAAALTAASAAELGQSPSPPTLPRNFSVAAVSSVPVEFAPPTSPRTTGVNKSGFNRTSPTQIRQSSARLSVPINLWHSAATAIHRLKEPTVAEQCIVPLDVVNTELETSGTLSQNLSTGENHVGDSLRSMSASSERKFLVIEVLDETFSCVIKIPLQYGPHILLSQVREMVCLQKELEPKEFVFVDEQAKPTKWSLDTMLQDAPGSVLRLKRQLRSKDPPLMLRGTFDDAVARNDPLRLVAVKYEPSLSLQEIVEAMCQRKQLQAKDYELKLTGIELSFDPSAKLTDLAGVSEVIVCRKNGNTSGNSDDASAAAAAAAAAGVVPSTKSGRNSKGSVAARRAKRFLPGARKHVDYSSCPEIAFTTVPADYGRKRVPTYSSIRYLLHFLFHENDADNVRDFLLTFPYVCSPAALLTTLIDLYAGKGSKEPLYQLSEEQLHFGVLFFLKVWVNENVELFQHDDALLGRLLDFAVGPQALNTAGALTFGRFWALLGTIHRKLLSYEQLRQMATAMQSQGLKTVKTDMSLDDTTTYFVGCDMLDFMQQQSPLHGALTRADCQQLGCDLVACDVIRPSYVAASAPAPSPARAPAGTKATFSEFSQYHLGTSESVENRIRFLECPPLQLAQQLTLAQHSLLRQVTLSMLCSWPPQNCSGSSPTTPVTQRTPFKALTHFATRVSCWLRFELVSSITLRERIEKLLHIIEVAKICRELHNYEGLAAAIDALNHPSILRLHKTWQYLPPKSRNLVLKLTQVVSPIEDYKAYRTALRIVQQSKEPKPFVPMLKVMMYDIQRLEATPTYVTPATVKMSSSTASAAPPPLLLRLVNARKLQAVARFASETLLVPQQLRFPFPFVHVLQRMLATFSLANLPRGSAPKAEKILGELSNDMWDAAAWQLSLAIEPPVEVHLLPSPEVTSNLQQLLLHIPHVKL
eukprot:TRINITY_DN588_c0_g1_i1.p1 TRINITY_DN588_c0_g1~~TRINITY_DN588_c0_g1_i1.p1  ORF type:complete len:1246 (-),score=246.64 TRINITY_DN588_c0_g1_i1:200-3748(-)